MSFILALDQGTTSSRALLFDHAGAVRAVAQQEFRQLLSAARLGRARRRRDLGDAIGRHARSARQGRHRRARRRRRRHHEPARDHRTVGPGDGRAGRPRHRLAGPAHGAAVRRAARRGPRADDRAQDGPRARRLLLGHEVEVAARQRSGRARARGEGRARLRHRRFVARLEPDPRRRARDRSVEREPHAPLRHPPRRLGRRRSSRSSTFPARCCRASSRRRRSAATRASTASTFRSPASRATSRRRSSVRPAIRRDSRRTRTAPAASC